MTGSARAVPPSSDGGKAAAIEKATKQREAMNAERMAWVEVLLDGGSNANLFIDGAFVDHGVAVRVPSYTIAGIAGAAEITHEISISVFIEGATGRVPTVNIHGAHRPGGRRNIISESLLYDECRLSVMKEPHMKIVWRGGEAPIYRRDGLYFARFGIRTDS